jgi:hypothetical protein
MQTGRQKRVAVPTTIHCDHLIEARTEGVNDLARNPRRKTRRSMIF